MRKEKSRKGKEICALGEQYCFNISNQSERKNVKPIKFEKK